MCEDVHVYLALTDIAKVYKCGFTETSKKVTVPVAPCPCQHLTLSFNFNRSDGCVVILYCNFN